MEVMGNPKRYQTAKRTTGINAVTNTLLAFLKIIAGFLGHSHALLTDGIHSLSDLISDALVLIAAKAGGKMPDKQHPYGHQRIETLAAIIIALLLLMVGGTIIYETGRHVYRGDLAPVHGTLVVIAALFSMGVKEWLYRYTLAKGRKIHSNLLITNALHNRSDVWISALVVLSAIGTLGGIPYADNICAGIIALIIIKSGIQLFLRGIQELIDTGVDEVTLAEIKKCIQSVSGVVSIHQLRTRSHGGDIFIDSHIIVNTFISVSEGHHIGEKVHEKLIQNFSQIADVTVHIDPENDETNRPSLDLPMRNEIIAQLQAHWRELPGFQLIEKIEIHYFNGQIYLEVGWPPHALPIEKWHEIQQSYLQSMHFLPQWASLKLWIRV